MAKRKKRPQSHPLGAKGLEPQTRDKEPQLPQNGKVAPREEKFKHQPFQLKDFIENILKLLAAIAALVTALTSGNRVVFYVLIVVAWGAISWLLLATVRRKALAVTAMLAVAIAVLAWVGFSGWKDYQKVRGIQFQPAKPGELLLIVAQFDHRGGARIDVTNRITDRLRSGLKSANIPNVRIEIASKIGNQEEAYRIGRVHFATLVIWGWYDDAGFNPHFTIVRESVPALETPKLIEVPRELREFNLYVREGLPTEMAFFVTLTIGQIYYLAGNYDESIRVLDAASKILEPGSRVEVMPLRDGLAILHFFRGANNFLKGDLLQAIGDFSKSIELDSKSGVAAVSYLDRGLAHLRLGKLDKAIADYTEAILLDPKYAAAYVNRGAAYLRTQNLDQAIADLTRAIGLNERLATAYLNRGVAYASKGNLDEAIADYTKAIDLDPKYAGTYVNRGNAYAEKGEINRAIADLTKAIQLEPRSKYAIVAFADRGFVFLRLGKLDQAIADFSNSIDLDPKQPGVYKNRGTAYHQKGDLDRAIADFTKAIELDPKHAESYVNRCLAYVDKTSFNEAITDCNRAIELSPEDAVAYNNRGLAYYRKGSFDQAVGDYSKAIELDPKLAIAYVNRGFIYYLRGLKPQAIADFENYIRLAPGGSERAKVERWLRELEGP